MVAITWLGNDDNSPMRGITGGNMPAKIWRDIMLYGNARQANSQFKDSHRDEKGGISGLLGRLLSSDNTPEKKKPRDDYSHLND